MMERLVSMGEARAQLTALIVEADDHPIYVTRHGKPVGVIASFERFERMIARLEDFIDIEASRAAKESSGGAVPFVPYDGPAIDADDVYTTNVPGDWADSWESSVRDNDLAEAVTRVERV